MGLLDVGLVSLCGENRRDFFTQTLKANISWTNCLIDLMFFVETSYDLVKFQEISDIAIKHSKLAYLKKCFMKFSEILHEQSSNPLTKPEYVVRRSRSYFGGNCIKHLFSKLKNEEFINFFALRKTFFDVSKF